MDDAVTRHMARMMRDIEAQQKANRIKKRKLRTLRRITKDQRQCLEIIRQEFNRGHLPDHPIMMRVFELTNF